MKDDIKKAVASLKSGGIILYPTDTIWGIGCDATNSKAVDKIYKIKGRQKTASFLILLEDVKKITQYVKETPEIIYDLIESFDFPTTIIYPKAINLAKNMIAPDGSIAIRIVREGFASDMLKAFGKPVVSTSANFSGEPSPLMFKDISDSLKEKMDYIVEADRTNVRVTKPSTIIRLKPNGEFEIIRD
ncbi:MAG: threonylcarbamoyl-AMP synthase [Bacteroidales bacterium]|nr:threonylcarbamoyl-AMP synthase [Bacteroidales bacterium]